MKINNIIDTVIFTSLIAVAGSISAAPVYSWNLAKDLTQSVLSSPTNPFGQNGRVWTAMYDRAGTSHNPVNYIAMPTFDSQINGYPWLGWRNPIYSWLMVGTFSQEIPNATAIRRGDVIIHPEGGPSAIVAWKSPIDGVVNISGAVLHMDNCGNGIKWFVDKGSSTLAAGSLDSSLGGAKISLQNIPVWVGTSLYFIISSHNEDIGCDTTKLDIIITGS